ncbi:MAG: hypothetical protein MUC34_03510 [Anaerolineae bacterium]|nr:hypothetical protein [Anaerolineae bacterium]
MHWRCLIDSRIAGLESRLNSFDPEERRAALSGLAGLLARGEIAAASDCGAVNMHCHTFFSYNAYGHSPSSLAWLAKKNGYTAIGIVDFDVLDAVDEFLDACELLGVRGSAGIETRVFIPEFATREINSPGEPGVYYHMGIGFTSSQVPPEARPILDSMRERAARRNREMLERINRHLAPLVIDYDAQVLPLTPAGNATERHMLAAIIAAAADLFPKAQDRVDYWAAKLAAAPDAIATTISDYAKFSNLVRAKLMKQGGVGYVKPSPEAFPTVEEFHSLILACGALPCATWLDGTSAGEQAIDELLGLVMSKGAVALNIIPDRNWNLPEGETRALKIRKLHEIVAVAQRLDLPLNIGTEMNSPGNRLIDDFAAAPLAPLAEAFRSGAYFIHGHTAMQRKLGLGYGSEWAAARFPDRHSRNAFYESVGRSAIVR